MVGDLSEHFSMDEFLCNCAGNCEWKDPNKIDVEFIVKMEKLRALYGKPIHINSGLRCPAWNEKHHSKPTSSHIKGCAGDLRVSDNGERWALVKAAMVVFRRVGVEGRFLHVDSDDAKPQDRMWVY